ncbi:MAG: 23S rRNA (uracil(1939)-C(5))-methyltransferase RlmD [candidate division WOR-3 bacterium]
MMPSIPEDKKEMICPYFNKCGGCDFQDLSYEEQLKRKIDLVKKYLNTEINEVFPSQPFNYRNRMDFAFFKNGIGLREKGKWYKFVDIEYCLIAKEKINTLLKEVREFFHDVDSFDIKKHIGTFRYAVIRSVLTSTISIILNQKSEKKEEAVNLIKNFAFVTSADNLLVCEIPPNTDVSVSEHYYVIKGTDLLYTKVKEKEFYFHSQGFFQVNDELTEKLHHYVSKILENYPTNDGYLLDFYGGVGVFGIINNEKFKQVTVLDNHSLSINLVKRNCELNHIKNVLPLLLEDKNLKDIRFPKPLFVIADPPRAGIHPKALKYLNKIKPELIIYISCNPLQLARDLKKLTNYQIKSLALFDFFPQTKNIELVCELLPI